MKKIVTLVLAIALLMTSVVAIAESKAIPNINTFAKMTTKFIEGSDREAKRYEIKLSKPVDKLWILWAEKGAEPDELAVDENLCATALAVEHKYMPGIKQSIGTSSKKSTSQNIEFDYVYTSEDKYGIKKKYYTVEDTGEEEWSDKPVYFYTDEKKAEKWTLEADYDELTGKIEGYWYSYPVFAGYDEDLEEPVFTYKWSYEESLDKIALKYEKAHDDGYEVKITEPTKVVSDKKVVVDKFGNKADEVVGYKDGYIQGVKTKTEVNKKLATNKATLGDRAFATLEGVTEDFAGWLVYRNRFGNFVAIEPYEGQL